MFNGGWLVNLTWTELEDGTFPCYCFSPSLPEIYLTEGAIYSLATPCVSVADADLHTFLVERCRSIHFVQY